MKNENEFISSAEMISSVFENLEKDKLEGDAKVLKAWKTTLQKISGNGQQLCDHSRVVDLKNGILLVETDHPAWSQMLQFHKKFILTGLNRLSGGVQIDSLAFRVRGSSASLASLESCEEVTKKEMEKYANKLENEQKALEEKGFVNKTAASNSFGGESLPEELKDIFSRMKNSTGKEKDIEKK